MQIKNKSILRVTLLAGSVFTCLVFAVNRSCRTPGDVLLSAGHLSDPGSSRERHSEPGPNTSDPTPARLMGEGHGMGVCRLQRRRSYRHTGSTKFRF